MIVTDRGGLIRRDRRHPVATKPAGSLRSSAGRASAGRASAGRASAGRSSAGRAMPSRTPRHGRRGQGPHAVGGRGRRAGAHRPDTPLGPGKANDRGAVPGGEEARTAVAPERRRDADGAGRVAGELRRGEEGQPQDAHRPQSGVRGDGATAGRPDGRAGDPASARRAGRARYAPRPAGARRRSAAKAFRGRNPLPVSLPGAPGPSKKGKIPANEKN
jgi:hypothetical protein